MYSYILQVFLVLLLIYIIVSAINKVFVHFKIKRIVKKIEEQKDNDLKESVYNGGLNDMLTIVDKIKEELNELKHLKK